MRPALTSVAVLLTAAVAVASSMDRSTHCRALAGQTVGPELIGLPSGVATLTSASAARLPSLGTENSPTVAYCRVLGEIAPRDSGAHPIRFQVNLPARWNGKAVQYGGGGFNGTLISGLEPLIDSPVDVPRPVASGYATWGTDSGHDATMLAEIQAFAANDEMLENFAYAAYKKVRDVGVEIARRYYGGRPHRIYYFGSSEGGREALAMAQRFPEDFDGIVSGVPVINWVGLMSAATRNGIAMMDGGWISPAKVKFLHDAVLNACDGEDGLSDGIISRYASCASSFDPRKIRCADGKAADDCLSDAQIAVLETMRRRYVFPFALANGVTSYPGSNYGGEAHPEGMVAWATGLKAPQYPILSPGEEGCIWYFAEGAVRYFLMRDASADPRKYRPEDHEAQVQRISALMDSTDPDLSRFRARGGKLILKENMADFAQSPFAGVEYYESVVARMGQSEVDSFMRLYIAPGADHAGTGVSRLDNSAWPQGVDLLGAVDGWVSAQAAPDTLVQVAQDARPPFEIKASRPLCRYPAWPRYNGSGSWNEAASFACTKDGG